MKEIKTEKQIKTDKTILFSLYGSFLIIRFLNSAGFFQVDTGGKNLFSIFTGVNMLALVAIILTINDLRTSLSNYELCLIAVSAILIASPSNVTFSLALTLMGLVFLFKGEDRFVSLGQLSLGLAWITSWGPFLLAIISPMLLPVETAIAFVPLSFIGKFTLIGNAIQGPQGHSVVVYSPCSAFVNTVSVAFMWLCLMKISHLKFSLKQTMGLLAALCVVVVLNTVRLALMAYSYSYYAFWHDGDGASLWSFATLFFVIIVFFIFSPQNKNERLSLV